MKKKTRYFELSFFMVIALLFITKETRKVMDEGSKYLFPIMFLLSTYGNMFFSLYKRHKDFQETKKNFRPGISNDLL